MNFKKYNEMELALLGAIAAMSEEEAESISMEKGDISFASMEDCTSTPFYLTKPSTARHAKRRKNTFRKKEERKDLAQKLGYNLSTEDSKVKNLLSANHMDRTYLRGYKAEKKHMTIKEEKAIMEREAVEEVREDMMESHNSILSPIAQDIDTLTLDMESIEHHIENLETEYKELRESMKMVYEKLQNACLRKSGIQAALLQKEGEFDTLSSNLKRERISRFGW